MAAALVYTLPTLQLVCHLVATGNSTIVDINPGTTPTPSPSPISALPNGYVAFSDFGVAYKIHSERRTWNEAKAICAEEGGHLADIDSLEKIQVLKDFLEREEHDLAFTGIHSIDDVWYSDRTGLPVSNLPWADGEPTGDGDCALMKDFAANRLGDYDCNDKWQFVCQI